MKDLQHIHAYRVQLLDNHTIEGLYDGIRLGFLLAFYDLDSGTPVYVNHSQIKFIESLEDGSGDDGEDGGTPSLDPEPDNSGDAKDLPDNGDVPHYIVIGVNR